MEDEEDSEAEEKGGAPLAVVGLKVAQEEEVEDWVFMLNGDGIRPEQAEEDELCLENGTETELLKGEGEEGVEGEVLGVERPSSIFVFTITD